MTVMLPRRWNVPRTSGRSWVQWATHLHAEALSVAHDDPDTLQALLQNSSEWCEAVAQQWCNVALLFSDCPAPSRPSPSPRLPSLLARLPSLSHKLRSYPSDLV